MKIFLMKFFPLLFLFLFSGTTYSSDLCTSRKWVKQLPKGHLSAMGIGQTKRKAEINAQGKVLDVVYKQCPSAVNHKMIEICTNVVDQNFVSFALFKKNPKCNTSLKKPTKPVHAELLEKVYKKYKDQLTAMKKAKCESKIAGQCLDKVFKTASLSVIRNKVKSLCKKKSAACSYYAYFDLASNNSKNAQATLKKHCQEKSKASDLGAICFLRSLLFFERGQGQKSLDMAYTACELDYAPACSAIAYENESKKDFVTAKEFYKKSCEKMPNLISSCMKYRFFEHKLKDTKGLVEYYKAGCREKNMDHCYELARIYSHEDPKQAFDVLAGTCKNNLDKGCVLLASIVEKKEGAKKAKRILSTACKKGLPRSCTNLAFIYKKEKKDKNYQKTINKACELNDHGACNIIGLSAQGKKDFKKATEVFSSSCQRNNAEACLHLGAMNEKNKKINDSLTAYKKSCYLNSPSGCFKFGEIELQRKSKEFKKGFERSCLLGKAAGCLKLADHFNSAKNKTKREFFLKKGCDLKSGKACFDLAKIFETKKLNNLSKEYLTLSCKFNYKDACKKK